MFRDEEFGLIHLQTLINDTTTVVKNYRVGTALLKKDGLYRD